MKISVVIPCYKSQEYIEGIVFEIQSVLRERPQYNYEIILVNDGSPDNTFNVIKKICKNDITVKALNLSRNFGQANAMMAGYNYISGEIIVHSDDDGQTPVNFLWNLVDELETGYDIVFAKFIKKENSIIQNFGSKLNNLMSEILIGKPKNLHLGNFWVCRKYVIEEIRKNQNPFPYIGGMFMKTTLNISQVETIHRPRKYGKSTYSFLKMCGLWYNGFTAFSIIPLRIASFLGITTALAGFAHACYLIIQKIMHDTVPEGYTSIATILLLVSGIIMILLGIIGEYIGRIYININKVPQYIVREEINTK